MSHNGRILYIEDNEFHQRLIRRILEPQGFEIVSCANGLEGIKKAVEVHPNLILIDMDLPYLDGLGVSAKIRSIQGMEHTAIVALASKAHKRDRDRALVAGCDGIVEKPVNAVSLAQQLRRYLAGEQDQLDPADKTRILKDFNLTLIDQLRSKIEELEHANSDLRGSKAELQLAYEQSQLWNQELQSLSRIKENIVAITSHELRTPLAIASGYVDLLLEGLLGDLSEEQKQVLEISRQNQEKMRDLIGKITDLTRLALKKIPMKLDVLDLNQLFKSVYQDMSIFMKIRKLKFSSVFCEEEAWVMADPGLLGQVFGNLMKNAICFTPDGGKIEVRTWIDDERVFFSVQDSGIGLRAEDIDRIFDEFYQVTDVTHHKTGQFEFMTRGIGVGLALCRGILNDLGGKIWAESKSPHQGSSFIFYLPLAKKE